MCICRQGSLRSVFRILQAKESWYDIPSAVYSKYNSTYKIPMLITFRSVTTCELQLCPEEQIQLNVLQYLPQLTDLTLKGGHYGDLGRVKQLTCLELMHCTIDGHAAPAFSPALVKLTMVNAKVDFVNCQLWYACTALRALRLDQHAKCFYKGCIALKPFTIFDESARNGSVATGALTSLSFDYSSQGKDACLGGLSNMVSLQCLKAQVSARSFELSTSVPLTNLRSLQISSKGYSQTRIVMDWQAFGALRYVKLHGVLSLTKSVIGLAKLPFLEEVQFRCLLQSGSDSLRYVLRLQQRLASHRPEVKCMFHMCESLLDFHSSLA